MLWLRVVFMLAVASSAAAQTANKDGASIFDPGDPSIKGSPSKHSPIPLLTPRPAGDPEITWRGANDEMGRIGGHAGQLRDAAAQSPTTETPPPTAAAPAPRHH